MQKSYNELMKRESSVGIMYEFPAINPIKHNELIMKAVNLFGETGLYMLIGKIESNGNSILQTTWFIQAMQQLCRVNPMKVSEFQAEILSYVVRIDLSGAEPQVNLTADKLIASSEFNVLPIPGADKKDPVILLNRLVVAALEEYIIPFVSMLSESDMFKNLTASLTTWLVGTPQMSTGSSGDQSTQDSSPLEAMKETRKKRAFPFGNSTKREK
jgi:hypothetical protein